jgi:flagella basal body P-ring formation protein FlgA
MTRFILALLLMLVSVAARGAEIMLRETAVLRGSIVRLGDVAEIVSTDADQVAELAAIPLLPAPAPGTQAFLSISQVRDLLTANAVNVGLVQIHGAATVAISAAAVNSPKPIVSGDIATVRPERSDVSQQVAAAIVQYLKEQTGHELWEVTINVDAKLHDLCWKSGPQLTIGGGQAPWTGRQSFDVAGVSGNAAVRTYANVVRVEMVVVAVRPIAAGDFVRATDVALRPHIGQMSDKIATSLEQVVGKETRQAIRVDGLLYTNQVRSPLLVRKGERVTVRARAGSVVVRTYGTVQQDGGLGELVQVQALEGRERYAARVSGLRELEVFAAGASADEVAGMAK